MPTVIAAPYPHMQSPAQITPSLIPIVAEDVFAQTVYVTEITITNKSAAAVTLVMADKQSTPRELIDTVIEGKTAYAVRFDGRYCPDGLTWVAGAADVLVGYVRGLV